MPQPELPMDYIAAVLANEVRVTCTSEALRAQLLLAGAKIVAGNIGVPFSSQQELASTLSNLQSLGIPFCDEPAGWPPAAVFQQLRDEGLVSGNIKTISWHSPLEPFFGQA